LAFVLNGIASVFSSLACGVGHNPNPVAPVRGTDGASRNNRRPPGVAETFQVSQHVVEAHRDVPSNVLKTDVARSEFINKPSNFRPEVAVILLAQSLPGMREGLAGVAGGEEVEAYLGRRTAVVNWHCKVMPSSAFRIRRGSQTSGRFDPPSW